MVGVRSKWAEFGRVNRHRIWSYLPFVNLNFLFHDQEQQKVKELQSIRGDLVSAELLG